MTKGSILVVDDNKTILQALEMLLPHYFKEVKMLSSPKTLISTLREWEADVVLLDMNFQAGMNTGNEGFYWLSEVKKSSPDSQVVLFTAYADIDIAVNAIKCGAFDFVVKPWDNAKLVATLIAACEFAASKKEVKQLREIKNEIKPGGEMYWGDSANMLELKSLVEKVALTDASILITGENGTGKDMLAREIHRLSPRKNSSMVAVDIGSLPESLFESELFGHVKGAFTDAKNNRAGKFEVAQGGTLFLDEIGNIPLHLQAKILTALQSRTIVRVGSNSPIPIDIRLVCATNKDLEQMVQDGTFREDLLYRINTIHIHIPPLRERKEDIIPFAKMFLKRYAAKYNKNIYTLENSAQKKLTEYRWSGNIRELQHTIEKAVILSNKESLSATDFILTNPSSESTFKTKETTLEEMEKEMIKSAVRKHSGNLSLVAQQLGITRQTLYNKLKKYEI